jgi:hypothetical protein
MTTSQTASAPGRYAEAAARVDRSPLPPHNLTAADSAERMLTCDPDSRRIFLDRCGDAATDLVFAEVKRKYRTPYAWWYDDPAGFCKDVLGQLLCSRAGQILNSVPHGPRNLAVPCAADVGQNAIVAGLLAWTGSLHALNSYTVLMVAPEWDHSLPVWHELHRLIGLADLPGECDEKGQWTLPNQTVLRSAPQPDETHYLAGIFAVPRLLIVAVDAGYLSHSVGDFIDAHLFGDTQRLLAIGSPDPDTPDTWFEELRRRPGTRVERLPVTDLPPVTSVTSTRVPGLEQG